MKTKPAQVIVIW